MKITLFNTYRRGGAGVAAFRLQRALEKAGVSAGLLTADEAGARWPFYAERLSFVPFERDKSVRFSFSLANFGHDLRRHPLVAQADVLHLHWINQGLLSLRGLQQLASLGKPLLWTLHDVWAFTGGCHIHTCDHFQESCGHCPYLRWQGSGDLSNRVWRRKKKFFPKNIVYVTPSRWLAEMARSSSLLREADIRVVPNPMDTHLFRPLSVIERRVYRQSLGISEGVLLLAFVAFNTSEPYKGFSYLVEALHVLKNRHPDLAVELLVLGKTKVETLAGLPYRVHAPGLVQDPAKMAGVFGASDLFVTPSLADNLPNTVMEALSCGTPVAAFRTGGIPEMVEHNVTGVLAPQRDSEALAEGIYKCLQELRGPALREKARAKVLQEYGEDVVAKAYMDLYQEILLHNISA